MTDATQAARPDMQQADLDAETLHALFRDMAAYTEIISVTLKQDAQAYTGETSVSLEHAEHVLMAGHVRGVQIRYRFQGVQWWDTLLRTDQGVRLVRIQHDFRELG